jgi:succinylarginine dihydrolase
MTEINFDGIPGPTHNYSGLALGNLAAEKHARQVANPRAAALQGLAKMRALAARGFVQAVLPPHERPDVGALRALGFAGSDAEVISALRARHRSCSPPARRPPRCGPPTRRQ